MRVVIGEDAALFREGLCALLESAGHRVVGRAGTASDAVAQTLAARPDIVILDVRMPAGDEGVQAALRLRRGTRPVPVMLLSQHIETRRTLELTTEGAVGYLLKDRVLDVDEFLTALHRVARGGTALDPEVVRRLLSGARVRSMLDALTPREAEVLALMAQGWSNRAISRRLFLSERTVETHIGSLMAKLDLPDSPDDNRRVRAILTYLEATSGHPAPSMR